MPELPEVETVRRGLEPLLVGRRLGRVVVREARLRRPVPRDLDRRLRGRTVLAVERRGKYLVLRLDRNALLVHLGMSGSLRRCPRSEPLRRHDHLRIGLDRRTELRFHDPRRFGMVLPLDGPVEEAPPLARLGPEPLGPAFHAEHLLVLARTRRRRTPLHAFLLDQTVVAGIGNIYASEALFLAGLAPGRAAGRLTRPRAERLVEAVRRVLQDAIEAGGTTLRDHHDLDGEEGWFARELRVYGRAGEPCPACGAVIRRQDVRGRSAFRCSACQAV